MNQTYKRYIKRIILGVFLAFFLYLLINAWLIWSYGEKEEIKAADVAIVLGAGVIGEEPSPVFRERINHGIWLYQNGYVKKLILTGGYGKGAICSEAGAAREYARRQGILEEDILIEEKSRITQENISYAKELMEEHGLTTALIVSDPLHMKRAMQMASDYGIEAWSAPTPTSRFVSIRTKLPFLLRELFFYTGYQVYRMIW